MPALVLEKDKYIGNATDGAANLQRSYKELSTLFASQSLNSHVHVWCYSRVLNLVLSDTTGAVVETTWYAKDAALRKLFGSFDKPENAVYIDLNVTLGKTEEHVSNKPHIRVNARSYTEGSLKHEAVLTAHTRAT